MNQELRIKNKGFTLIELLIVISIIGVLATLLLVNFVGVRQRARDGQRKSNLSQIQSALELYRADVGSYPSAGASNRLNATACSSGSSGLSSGGTVYIAKIPCDPLSGLSYNSGDYYYSSGGSTYTLGACIENGSDQNQNITSSSPGGSGTCPTTGSTPKYYVITNP